VGEQIYRGLRVFGGGNTWPDSSDPRGEVGKDHSFMDATCQGRQIMEKAFEFFDQWLKSQQDFLDNWIRSQKELMDIWFDSIKKIQLSFSTMAGSQGVSPQIIGLFNSWFATMLNSTKAFNEGIMNLQNAWKTMIEKQMEMSKEIAKHFFALFPKVEETK
jgi:hypothetical protein